MILYGDPRWSVRADEALTHLRDGLRAGDHSPTQRTRALVDAGMCVQQALDRRMERTGVDDEDDGSRMLHNLLVAVARGAPLTEAALSQLEALVSDGFEEPRLPEGYAFYSVYPELYALAAVGLPPGRWAVIGVRSIGTSLGAAVAAALGPDATLYTVRPVGHPFRRELRLAPRLCGALCQHDRFAVVDEGPGMSGSTFGCIADWLEERGVPPARIHFFPSHKGDLGPEASIAHRARWSHANRHTVPFQEAPTPLAPVQDLVQERTAPFEDLSAGLWRHKLFTRESDWPAAHRHQERSKFRINTERGPFLAKFQGLGSACEERAEDARALADAGFSPAVEGTTHGWLVTRWESRAQALWPVRETQRRQVMTVLPRYLAFRAARFKARKAGASIGQLVEMTRFNLGIQAGAIVKGCLDEVLACESKLQADVRPVRIDGKLQPWEWISCQDGRILKTDALDHHCAHDLIGCQDIAWDIAGARVEFGLEMLESVELQQVVTLARGEIIPPLLLRLYLAAYVAFQLGRIWAEEQHLGAEDEERRRLRDERVRYLFALASSFES